MMSYLTYLGQGTRGIFEPYRRDQFPADRVEATGSSGNFEGRISHTNETDTSKVVKLDDAVTITTVSDKVRSQSKSVWSGQRRKCSVGFGASLGGGITSIAGAVALVTVLAPLWPVAIAVGTVGLGAIGFSVFNGVRMNQARVQEQLWNNPLPKFQYQRRLVGEKGFYHAYASGYQNKLVAQDEFLQLWYKQMDDWAVRYLSDSPTLKRTKIDHIREFMEHSPLSKEAFAATFSGEDEEFLKKLSARFEAINQGYEALKKQTVVYKSRIKKEQSRKNLENDRQRDALLLPYQFMQLRIGAVRARINSLNHQIFQRETSNITSVTIIDRSGRVVPGRMIAPRADSFRRELPRLQAELCQLESAYDFMTAPIHALHLQNRARITDWAEGELRKIDRDEEEQLLTFYPHIKKLLEDYRNREIDEEVESIESNLELELSEEAPELEKEYTPQQWKPEWEEIIGEVDWKNNILTQTTIYHS